MPILEWLNKGEATKVTKKLPYRMLKANAELSYGEQSENMIIKGDNLEALQALLPYYKGQVKCIYIDPPYNTGGAFEHYDDNLEHSKWLSLIYPRLELLWQFLSDEGSIWISIDDDEAHYLKVICDEIFGRNHFIVSNVWQKRYSRENREAIGDVHEYIMVYAKEPKTFKEIRNKVPFTEEQAKIYKNPNNDPNGRWRAVPMTAQAGHATKDQFYEITTPSGKIYTPPTGRCWGISKATYEKLLQEGRIYFGKNNDSQPNIIRYLKEVEGSTPWSWWPSNEVGHNDESKKEILELFHDNLFDTPKPERLVQRIIHIATNEGDLVLDSFLGSGTTCAVAQKMGRRYIGIEMGEHAITHCVPRMKAVIDGEQGGISKAVNWNGGGGYTFYDLGETIFDENGNINKQVDFRTLASHVWFTETKTPLSNYEKSPLLGIHNGVAYYLLFNGILGDKKPDGGNVLTQKVFNSLPQFNGKKVIYGEATRMNVQKLKDNNIVFKQTPYDVKAR